MKNIVIMMLVYNRYVGALLLLQLGNKIFPSSYLFSKDDLSYETIVHLELKLNIRIGLHTHDPPLKLFKCF